LATAYPLIHSGAAPAAGRSLMSLPRPPALTQAVAAIRIRELSTQAPMCRTGGIPTVSQTSARPGPQYLAADSGDSRPYLPAAMAEQPVVRTMTSFFSSSLIITRWELSWVVRQLLQPT